MRKLAVTLALATTALATPALARDNAWYVGVEGGAMIVEDIDYDLTTPTGGVTTIDSNYGYDVGGTVGYDFGALRVEAEVAYKSASVDEIRTTGSIATGANTQVGAGTYSGGGRTSALSFMANAMLDFGADDSISGFVGGGAGIARVKASDYRVVNSFTALDDSDTVFAWQAIAGIRAPLSENVDVSLKYRFFNADDVRIQNVRGVGYDGRFRSHSLLGGLTVNFGEPTPPPPPPAPVETPPPPPAPVETPPPPPVVCTPGPYIVFFEWDKSDVTPEAAGILDNAISNYQSCGNAQVMLAGHADRSGSASYNVGLSQRRADAVRAYLEGRGIGGGAISTEAFGEGRPRVETADGVRELQNRRVEITYGPGSGM
jgi:outer membrane protein OmpA-like peptidoglycan-associated protein/opacity protein-like surface antigen